MGLAGVHEATRVLVTTGVHVVVIKVGLPTVVVLAMEVPGVVVVSTKHEEGVTAVGPVVLVLQVVVTKLLAEDAACPVQPATAVGPVGTGVGQVVSM